MRFIIPLLPACIAVVAMMPDASGKEARLLVDVQAPIIVQGRQAGTTTLTAGTLVNVVSVQSDGALVSRGTGGGFSFKVAKDALPSEALVEPSPTPAPEPVKPQREAARTVAAPGSDYQWSMTVKPITRDDKPAVDAKAFLWIPPDCKRVRGIVIGQYNMEEPTIMGHPVFRKALSELGFAEIFISPNLGSIHFRYDKGADVILEGILRDFAKLSGYKELEFAPLVPIGHSAMASLPFDIAIWKPDRTLAALSISGQWPYWTERTPDDPNGSPDYGDKNLDGVPCLVTKGDYELGRKNNTVWDGWYGGCGRALSAHPDTTLTQVVEPGCGHFEVSDEKVDLLAKYLKKAAQYRLPTDAPHDASPKLTPIKPEDGWLFDGWRRDQEPTAAAASYGSYSGKKQEAFFAFDEEMAEAIGKFQSGQRGKKFVPLSFTTKSGVTPHRGDHVDCHLPFEPLEDGITLPIGAVFLDKDPWTKDPAEQAETLPTPPASEQNKIKVGVICGYGKQKAPGLLTVNLDRTLGKVDPSSALTMSLWADYPGNDKFKRVVQQGEVKFWPNKQGEPQEITFPTIPDQHASPNMPPVKLKAESSAKLPVRYFVREGPAEVDDEGNLTFTPIPPRSTYPIKVTVVAWQWGRQAQPQVQTAPLAEQTFSILAPKR